MTELPYRTALIVGAGAGISASVARALAAAGLKLGLAARNIDKLAPLAAETGAERFAADASDPAAVAHFVIDGGVRSARRPDPPNRPNTTLDPDAIAQTYLEVLRQPRSAWSLEVEMRPWVETF